MLTDFAVAPLEIKLVGNADQGAFEGYGAFFGNVDSHGDMILPGAFKASLAQRMAGSRTIPMHVNHGLSLLGGQRGVGVWDELAEDGKGLRVKGRISGMNTDAGRNLFERVKDGAFPGMSIGYIVPSGGATYGKKAGEPRRSLKSLDLHEVSIVDAPSNASALVDGFKAAGVLFQADPGSAASSLAEAMRLHDKHMGGESYSYSGASLKERAQVMNHMRDAHEALTGQRAPVDLVAWKAAPTIRDVEAMLREECGVSHAEARAIAERRFKSAPRDEGSTTHEGASALRSVLEGFKLPS